MLKRNFKRHITASAPIVGGLFVVIGSLVVSNGKSFFQQGRLKTITPGIVIRNIENDPVRISAIKVGTVNHSFKEQFNESDDWLKKLSVEVENKTNKPITYLELYLTFPETRSTGTEMNFVVYLGNRPGSAAPAKRENLYLAPEGKLTVNMSDRQDWLESFLQPRHSMSQINKVEMQVGIAVFDDKTAWGGGQFYVEDPNKSGRYIPVTAKSTP